MTNYERIKNMSIEEMADNLAEQVGLQYFVPCGLVCNGHCTVMKTKECIEMIKQWLESEI